MSDPGNPITVYTGRTTNWVVLIIAVAATTLVIAMSGANGDRASLLAGAAALVVLAFTLLTFSSLRVTVGNNGLSVRACVFGWPRVSCLPEEIESAEPVNLSPLWWGVGVWWMPWGDIRFAWRSGSSIRVKRSSGRAVVVNVDDPASAISAIDIARSRAVAS